MSRRELARAAGGAGGWVTGFGSARPAGCNPAPQCNPAPRSSRRFGGDRPRHTIPRHVEEALGDGVGEAVEVGADAVAEAVDELVGAAAHGHEHVAGGGGDEEVAAEAGGQAEEEAAEEEPRGVVAVLLGDDGRAAALAGLDDLYLELRRVLVEVLAGLGVKFLDGDAPADHLLGGDADGHLGEI